MPVEEIKPALLGFGRRYGDRRCRVRHLDLCRDCRRRQDELSDPERVAVRPLLDNLGGGRDVLASTTLRQFGALCHSTCDAINARPPDGSGECSAQ